TPGGSRLGHAHSPAVDWIAADSRDRGGRAALRPHPTGAPDGMVVAPARTAPPSHAERISQRQADPAPVAPGRELPSRYAGSPGSPPAAPTRRWTGTRWSPAGPWWSRPLSRAPRQGRGDPDAERRRPV